jgi:hypothetical protein
MSTRAEIHGRIRTSFKWAQARDEPIRGPSPLRVVPRGVGVPVMGDRQRDGAAQFAASGGRWVVIVRGRRSGG